LRVNSALSDATGVPSWLRYLVRRARARQGPGALPTSAGRWTRTCLNRQTSRSRGLVTATLQHAGEPGGQRMAASQGSDSRAHQVHWADVALRISSTLRRPSHLSGPATAPRAGGRERRADMQAHSSTCTESRTRAGPPSTQRLRASARLGLHMRAGRAAGAPVAERRLAVRRAARAQRELQCVAGRPVEEHRRRTRASGASARAKGHQRAGHA